MNLRRERLRQGLTQQAVAELSGVHWTYVSDLERRKQAATIDVVAKLASALEVTPADLLKE